jgi:alanine racemase
MRALNINSRISRTQQKIYRPTWVEINTQAFKENLSNVKKLLKKNTKIIAVVKANAYGHGAAPLSKIAERSGVYALGVSSIEEGLTLRHAGVKSRILILGSVSPLENLAVAAKHGLTPTISSIVALETLRKISLKLKKKIPFHLKIETGMCRIGISPQGAKVLLERVAAYGKQVSMDGMYTHFAESPSNALFTMRQLEEFLSVRDYAKNLGIKFLAHAANSAAIINFPQAQLDAVRPGISLYGLSPAKTAAQKIALRPVLEWKSKIVFIKEVGPQTPVSYGCTFVTNRKSVIATLPVGYADGYMRCLSNNAHVLVRGKKCPVVGRVTMDMLMIDVTDVPGKAGLGDEAVLLGAQGGQAITADDLAAWAKTISYEITCAISSRVPRVLI